MAAYTPGPNDERRSLVLDVAVTPVERGRSDGPILVSVICARTDLEVGVGAGAGDNLLALNIDEDGESGPVVAS